VSKFYIGYIAKCHGLHGHFSLKLDFAEDLCLLFDTIKIVYLQDNNEPQYVTKAIPNSKVFLRTKIKSVNTREEVKKILRHKVYIKIGDHSNIEKAINKKNELLNFKVIESNHGEIGIITEIDFKRNQPLLIIQKNNNKILVPYVKDFIKKIDHSSNIIELNLPEGLLEICTI